MNDTDWFLLTWCVGVFTNVPKSMHFSHIYILEINLMHHLFVVKLNKQKKAIYEKVIVNDFGLETKTMK